MPDEQTPIQLLSTILDHLDRNDFDPGEALARQASEQHPLDSRAWDLLGRLRAMQGRTELAWEAYEQAWAVSPRPSEEFVLHRVFTCYLHPASTRASCLHLRLPCARNFARPVRPQCPPA